MSSPPGRRLNLLLDITVQLLVFTGCETLEFAPVEVTARPLRPCSRNPELQPSWLTGLENTTDAARLTALLAEVAAAIDMVKSRDKRACCLQARSCAFCAMSTQDSSVGLISQDSKISGASLTNEFTVSNSRQASHNTETREDERDCAVLQMPLNGTANFPSAFGEDFHSGTSSPFVPECGATGNASQAPASRSTPAHASAAAQGERPSTSQSNANLYAGSPFFPRAVRPSSAGIMSQPLVAELLSQTNVTPDLVRADSRRNDEATGLLEVDLFRWHAALKGGNPQRVGPFAAGEVSAEHSQSEAFVQLTRGPDRPPDWAQVHHSAAYASNLPGCPLDCLADWLGDGWCDTECNHQTCDLDGGDCKGWCGGECRPHWPGDGECDVECYKEECQWDGGDCPKWQQQKLPSVGEFVKYVKTYERLKLTAAPEVKPAKVDQLFVTELQNREAKSDSRSTPDIPAQAETPEETVEEKETLGTERRQQIEESKTAMVGEARERERREPASSHKTVGQTRNDQILLQMVRGDACACNVREGKQGNGVCNPECNSYECHFDGFDCHQMCSEECPHVWLGDGKCDKECDIPECFHDKGDCWECAPGCRLWMIGNNICDNFCNAADCWFDHGDCNDITKVIALDYNTQPYVYQFCAKDFIGDGKCDDNCYNEESAWDGGDCTRTAYDDEISSQKSVSNVSQSRFALNSTG